MDTLRKVPTTYHRDIAHIFVIYHLAVLSFVAAGIIFLLWGASGFYGIVAATFLSYLAAFVDTWLLVIEINR